MRYAQRILAAFLVMGGVSQMSPSIALANSDDPMNSGYLTDSGTLLVVGDNALAIFAPPWDPHQLHVFFAKHDSAAGHVHWYKVPNKKLYFGLDHRGSHDAHAYVWIYYHDAQGHLHKYPYAAKVRPLASDEARALVAAGPKDNGASGGATAPDSANESPLPNPLDPRYVDPPVMPLDDPTAPPDDAAVPPDDSTYPPLDPFGSSPDDADALEPDEPEEPKQPFSDFFSRPSAP